jgi:hypothetical protein
LKRNVEEPEQPETRGGADRSKGEQRETEIKQIKVIED